MQADIAHVIFYVDCRFVFLEIPLEHKLGTDYANDDEFNGLIKGH